LKQKVKKLPIGETINLAEYLEYMAYDIFIYCGNIFNIHNYVIYGDTLAKFITDVIKYYENPEIKSLPKPRPSKTTKKNMKMGIKLSVKLLHNTTRKQFNMTGNHQIVRPRKKSQWFGT
jgi:hypothetical protein